VSRQASLEASRMHKPDGVTRYTMSETPKPGHHKRKGLVAIAVFKLFKVTVLGIVGGLALALSKSSRLPARLDAWSNALGNEREWLHRALDTVTNAGDNELAIWGLGSLAYALVFSVEGLGLWFEKTWAEYLTVIVTLSFIPFEVYELTQGFNVGTLIGLVINVVILVYLVVRLVKQHGEQKSTRPGLPVPAQ
jgi:uncharacterized membrane protein (DUF2068 family)